MRDCYKIYYLIQQIDALSVNFKYLVKLNMTDAEFICNEVLVIFFGNLVDKINVIREQLKHNLLINYFYYAI